MRSALLVPEEHESSLARAGEQEGAWGEWRCHLEMGAACSCESKAAASVTGEENEIIPKREAKSGKPSLVLEPDPYDSLKLPIDLKDGCALDSKTTTAVPTPNGTCSSCEEAQNGSFSEEDNLSTGFEGMASREVVSKALERAQALYRLGSEVFAAEEVLCKALHELEKVRGFDEDLGAAEDLRKSPIFDSVSQRVAQFEAAIDLFYTPMQVLWSNEDGTLELQTDPTGRYFDYRLTLEIEAPLTHCMATATEVDLVPLAQPIMHKAPDTYGEVQPWCIVMMITLRVILTVELLMEYIRLPNTKYGYLVELISSEFPEEGRGIPPKPNGFTTLRPWVWTSNLWLPRGNGKTGTVLMQVTRTDAGCRIPSFISNYVFQKICCKFISDVRGSAARVSEDGNPWAPRVESDPEGFYGKLRDVDAAASKRQGHDLRNLPLKKVFDRTWMLHPSKHDCRSPSLRSSVPLCG